MSRSSSAARGWWSLTAIAAGWVALAPAAGGAQAGLKLGGRLEPLVDDYLIERLSGGARQVLHSPTPREVAITHDAPWEGSASGYHTVFKDGNRYRMYYRGQDMEVKGTRLVYNNPESICYAESADGIRFTKPKLGIVEFAGSRENNILRDRFGTHNFAPVIDTRPNCPAEARYKALGGVKGAKEGDGLFAFRSADGIHWELLSEKPVLTQGFFDSQNIAFWDAPSDQYRAYFRDFRDGGRDIKTSTSPDFLHWSTPEFLDYVDGRKTQLYTNQVIPSPGAPHILLGFPTRYITGRGLLTPLNEMVARAHPRYGNDYTDGGFMTSRDGKRFKVWSSAFLRPGPTREGRWMYGGHYQNWGLVETHAEASIPELQPFLPPDPGVEWSLYSSEGGWAGHTNRMRRYTVRQHGLVSVQTRESLGELLTRPIEMTGGSLEINFATSAAGALQVEIQSPEGTPVPGYALADCPEQFGDSTTHRVRWRSGDSLKSLTGKTVRLRFALRDADLFALRFR